MRIEPKTCSLIHLLGLREEDDDKEVECDTEEADEGEVNAGEDVDVAGHGRLVRVAPSLIEVGVIVHRDPTPDVWKMFLNRLMLMRSESV